MIDANIGGVATNPNPRQGTQAETAPMAEGLLSYLKAIRLGRTCLG